MEKNFCSICGMGTYCFSVLNKFYCEECNEEGCLINLAEIIKLKNKVKEQSKDLGTFEKILDQNLEEKESRNIAWVTKNG